MHMPKYAAGDILTIHKSEHKNTCLRLILKASLGKYIFYILQQPNTYGPNIGHIYERTFEFIEDHTHEYELLG